LKEIRLFECFGQRMNWIQIKGKKNDFVVSFILSKYCFYGVN